MPSGRRADRINFIAFNSVLSIHPAIQRINHLDITINKESAVKNWVRNNKGFLAFLLMFGIFRTAVADWNPIPSASMHPNLLEGDVVLVNRLAFDLKLPLTDMVLARIGEPARGDIVTFHSPRDGTLLIKRLVAVPGDTVEMRNERLFINGRGADYRLVEESIDSVGGSALRAGHLAETMGEPPRQL